MNDLISKTAKKIAVDYCRLSIVRNADGFLARDEVAHALDESCGLHIVKGSNLALRIHYELEYKQHETERFVYLCDNTDSLVPDMVAAAYVTAFDVADLFPLFADKSILYGLDLETLTIIHQRSRLKRLNMAECMELVNEVRREVTDRRKKSLEALTTRINELCPDWSAHADQGISAVSRVMVEAIRQGVYEGIDQKIQTLNEHFQWWIDKSYFGMLNSNALLHPKSVNRILPHIQANHSNDDLVALIVVDGLSYWQYAVLREYMAKAGVEVIDGTTLAWIPTITMLSRQAIFRGDIPQTDYKQSPANEQKLWFDYWTQHSMAQSEVQYLSDKDEFAVTEGVKRLAYVTVEMDEKMHASTDYRDLLSLTDNWCPRITEKIQVMRRMGYRIYLTTDHGSVLSHGWRPISQVEKVFLYKDGSRGKRHLIYTDVRQKEAFYKAHHEDVSLLSHDKWLAARTNFCFARSGTQEITHGGSHLWEVIIPFITINQ